MPLLRKERWLDLNDCELQICFEKYCATSIRVECRAVVTFEVLILCGFMQNAVSDH